MSMFWQIRFEPIWKSTVRFAFFAIALNLSATIAFAQTPTAEVRTIEGAEIAGTLLDVSVDQLKLKTADGTKTIELQQIESIEFPESARPQVPSKAAKFQLQDGSSVFVGKYKYDDGKIKATLSTGEEVLISKRNVSSIVFAVDQKSIQKQVDKIKQDANIAADTLVVIRDEQFNAIEGVVKELDQDSVQFAIDDQSANVPISKLKAITFFKAGKKDFSDPMATCVLSDTSQIKLRSFKIGTKQFALTSLTGELFNVEFSKVASLKFSSTVSVSLTEIAPSTNDWRPLLADSGIVDKLRKLRLARINESFNGHALALEFPRPAAEVEAGKSRSTTREFESGIAIQGGGRVAWRLDGNYQQLSGLVGFSPQASEFGDVKLRISVDGDVVFEQKFAKNSMIEPEPFNLDLTDKQRMIIEVDYADGRSIGDVIHLVNLILQK